MPGYVEKALARFDHPPPDKPEDAPYPFTEPVYGVKQQLTDPIDDSDPINKEQKLLLQQAIGVFLFYARAIDSTMLVALGTLAAAQNEGTEKTMTALVTFLNYAATHPDAEITFRGSDMLYTLDSDASYLSEPKARSRAGGYHYLGDKQDTHPDSTPPEHKNIKSSEYQKF